MEKRQRVNTSIERQLRAALELTEDREVRYHIRESMQLLHLDDEE